MENKELRLAWQIIANTGAHLFLTGRAGTGKTTFLHELRNTLPKRMVVVAPTGIAAINAQGTTIHSFFQLPFGPNIPGMQAGSKKRFQFRKKKLRLLRSIDLIVIDEISMVRADLLDAIDEVLRQYRDHNRPFGGVQMLMIGDMQQLPPVVTDEEWRLLSPYYATPYFFSSHVLQQAEYVTVELTHVYRQSDTVFIDILNKVRTNTADAQTLEQLNKRYIPNFTPRKEEGYIRLTTHNYQADEINRRELDALTSTPKTFRAMVQGEFPETSYPTEEALTLKVGAQVMFVKNDSSPEKEYYNGMIGEVVDIDNDVIRVRTADGDNIIDVGHETWENVKYAINEETKEVEEEKVGAFTQYPLKTAWAITVHKSQGLTFQKAIIDVHQSFAHGQTYVALSRCKTLEGLVLSAPIPPYAIINDKQVTLFANDPQHRQPDENKLDQMQRQYMLRIIEELFDYTPIRYCFTDTVKCMREFFYKSHPKTYNAWVKAAEQLKEVENVARRFHVQYQNMIMTLPDYQHSPQLQERLKKGAEYFIQQTTYIGSLLNKTDITTENKQAQERINNLLQTMQQTHCCKFQLLHYVANNEFETLDYLKKKAKLTLCADESEKKPRKRKS